MHPYYFDEGEQVIHPDVDGQNNSVDCGIFAIAYGVSLLFGQKPEYVTYDRKLMRTHFLNMFNTRGMSSLPHLEKGLAAEGIVNHLFNSHFKSIDRKNEKLINFSQKSELKENIVDKSPNCMKSEW